MLKCQYDTARGESQENNTKCIKEAFITNSQILKRCKVRLTHCGNAPGRDGSSSSPPPIVERQISAGTKDTHVPQWIREGFSALLRAAFSGQPLTTRGQRENTNKTAPSLWYSLSDSCFYVSLLLPVSTSPSTVHSLLVSPCSHHLVRLVYLFTLEPLGISDALLMNLR